MRGHVWVRNCQHLNRCIKTCLRFLAAWGDLGDHSACCVSSRMGGGITTAGTFCSDSEEYGNLIK